MMSLLKWTGARRMLMALAAFIVASSGRQARAESPLDTLTEWAIPFADASPLWIAVAGSDVVFSNFDVDGYIGRLDPSTGLVTRWRTPYTPTVPSAIAVRPADGAVILTGASYPDGVFEAEIGEFDLAAGVLRRWPMPTSGGVMPAGPLHLTVARDGKVLFQTYDLALGFSYVGRLDTATGALSLWRIFASSGIGIWQVAPGPGDTVFGNFTGDERGLFRLDLATGALTTWSTGSAEPVYAIASDSVGNLYFQQLTSEWMISRLEPATGRLTQWPSRPEFTGQMLFSDGRAWFGRTDALVALDVSHPGREGRLTPLTGTIVAPASFTVAPAELTLVAETALATARVSRIRRRHHSAFDSWTVEGARGLAITPSRAVYFNETAAVIGRITN